MKLRAALISSVLAGLAPLYAGCADRSADDASVDALEASFQAFLEEYWAEIKERDKAYLQTVHPELPEDAYDFFFDATLQMMEHSEKENLERTIECQEFRICKVIYPQPIDSWAAQQFIRHEGSWRWLP